MAMIQNVGGMDRTARIVGGLIFLMIGLLVPMITVLKVIVYLLAAVGLVTGILQLCPVNALMGINTKKSKTG